MTWLDVDRYDSESLTRVPLTHHSRDEPIPNALDAFSTLSFPYILLTLICILMRPYSSVSPSIQAVLATSDASKFLTKS